MAHRPTGWRTVSVSPTLLMLPGGGNSGDGVAGAGSGESGVWHKTVICWLVLVAYLYIHCENYAFAALPLLVFAASKVRREPDFSRADASTRPEMDQNPE